jgi:hypothetical protein
VPNDTNKADMAPQLNLALIQALHKNRGELDADVLRRLLLSLQPKA